MPSDEPDVLVLVRLLRPHEHAGNQYAPKSTLTVTDGEAKWLVTRGIAEIVVIPALLVGAPLVNAVASPAKKSPTKAATAPKRRACCGGIRW